MAGGTKHHPGSGRLIIRQERATATFRCSGSYLMKIFEKGFSLSAVKNAVVYAVFVKNFKSEKCSICFVMEVRVFDNWVCFNLNLVVYVISTHSNKLTHKRKDTRLNLDFLNYCIR